MIFLINRLNHRKNFKFLKKMLKIQRNKFRIYYVIKKIQIKKDYNNNNRLKKQKVKIKTFKIKLTRFWTNLRKKKMFYNQKMNN